MLEVLSSHPNKLSLQISLVWILPGPTWETCKWAASPMKRWSGSFVSSQFPPVPFIQEIPWLAHLQGQSLHETPQQGPLTFFFSRTFCHQLNTETIGKVSCLHATCIGLTHYPLPQNSEA